MASSQVRLMPPQPTRTVRTCIVLLIANGMYRGIEGPVDHRPVTPRHLPVGYMVTEGTPDVKGGGAEVKLTPIVFFALIFLLTGDILHHNKGYNGVIKARALVSL